MRCTKKKQCVEIKEFFAPHYVRTKTHILHENANVDSDSAWKMSSNHLSNVFMDILSISSRDIAKLRPVIPESSVGNDRVCISLFRALLL